MELSRRARALFAAGAIAWGALGAWLVATQDGRGEPATDHPTATAAATPQEEAEEIVAHDQLLRQGIDTWLGSAGDPPGSDAPPELRAEAHYLRDKVRSLAARGRAAATQVIRAVGPLAGSTSNPDLAADLKSLVAATRKLRKLSKGSRNPNIQDGPAPPLSELTAHYAKAKRRSGIHSKYLAAIHHVETKFGRVTADSVAGAKGPMQFIPSTWKIYGRGGNIQDPHDAILAAGRLLRANGAPGNYSRALYAYNNHGLYVAAVHAYARLIGRDPYALEFLYCWGP
jgi:membrane-bound lytic murein transglycosylase B